MQFFISDRIKVSAWSSSYAFAIFSLLTIGCFAQIASSLSVVPSKPQIGLVDFGSIIHNASPNSTFSNFIPNHFVFAIEASAEPNYNESLAYNITDTSLENILAMKKNNFNFKVFGYFNMSFQYVQISNGYGGNSLPLSDAITFGSQSYLVGNIYKIWRDPTMVLQNEVDGNPICVGNSSSLVFAMDPASPAWMDQASMSIRSLLSASGGSVYDGMEIDDVWSGDPLSITTPKGIAEAYDFSDLSLVNYLKSENGIPNGVEGGVGNVSQSIVSSIDPVNHYVLNDANYFSNFNSNVNSFLGGLTTSVAQDVKLSNKVLITNGSNHGIYLNGGSSSNTSAQAYSPLNGYITEGFVCFAPYNFFVQGELTDLTGTTSPTSWVLNVNDFSTYSTNQYLPPNSVTLASNGGAPYAKCPLFVVNNFHVSLNGTNATVSSQFLNPNYLLSPISNPILSIPENFDQLMNQRIYSMASYLMAETSNSVYSYTSDFTFLNYFPEFDLNYGTTAQVATGNVVGEFGISFIDKNDFYWSSRPPQYYFMRDFSNSTAYVNPCEYTGGGVAGNPGYLTPSASLTSPSAATLMVNLVNENVGGIINNPNYNGFAVVPPGAQLPYADPAYTTAPGYVQYVPVPANTILTLPPTGAIILMKSAWYEAEALGLKSTNAANTVVPTVPVSGFSQGNGVAFPVSGAGTSYACSTAPLLTVTVNGVAAPQISPIPPGSYLVEAQVQRGPTAGKWSFSITDPVNPVSPTSYSFAPVDDYAGASNVTSDDIGFISLGATGSRTLTWKFTGNDINTTGSGQILLDYIRLVPQPSIFSNGIYRIESINAPGLALTNAQASFPPPANSKPLPPGLEIGSNNGSVNQLWRVIPVSTPSGVTNGQPCYELVVQDGSGNCLTVGSSQIVGSNNAYTTVISAAPSTGAPNVKQVWQFFYNTNDGGYDVVSAYSKTAYALDVAQRTHNNGNYVGVYSEKTSSTTVTGTSTTGDAVNQHWRFYPQ